MYEGRHLHPSYCCFFPGHKFIAASGDVSNIFFSFVNPLMLLFRSMLIIFKMLRKKDFLSSFPERESLVLLVMLL